MLHRIDRHSGVYNLIIYDHGYVHGQAFKVRNREIFHLNRLNFCGDHLWRHQRIVMASWLFNDLPDLAKCGNNHRLIGLNTNPAKTKVQRQNNEHQQIENDHQNNLA